jgi:hypothetical protein
MKVNSFPCSTPKMHLVKLSFHRNLQKLLNISSRSEIVDVLPPRPLRDTLEVVSL